MLVLPVGRLGRHAAKSQHNPEEGPFLALHPDFVDVVGQKPVLSLVASTEKSVGGSGESLFHEAGVWAPNSTGGDVYITSNIISADEEELHIKICRLRLGAEADVTSSQLHPDSSTSRVYVAKGVEYEDLPQLADEVVMANGATAYGKSILWCSQGQHKQHPKRLASQLAERNEGRRPGSLILARPKADGTFETETLLNNYRGREFNALNDVAVHRQSGSIFFTDPDYGVKQGFKGESQLPNGVWRLSPKTGALAMVADGLRKPNGVVCSPDGKTCYVTDTDFIHGDGSTDLTRPGTIYAYDVVGDDAPQLHNKRLFALVDCGAPDGIKCDQLGRVYTGTFEGVDVYHPNGILLGKILLPPDAKGEQRGCANLVFGAQGQLFILSETSVWVAQLASRGDLEGLEQ